MFKIKYSEMNHDALIPGLKKLGNISGLEMKKAYNISKVYRAIAKEQDIAKERFRTEQLANKEKYDAIQKMEEGDEKKAALDKFEAEGKEAFAKFFDFEVTIERDQIPMDIAEKAGLTAFELEALEPILVDTTSSA